MLESGAPRLTDRRSEPPPRAIRIGAANCPPPAKRVGARFRPTLDPWSAMYLDVLLEGLERDLRIRPTPEAAFTRILARSLSRAAHRLSDLDLLPAGGRQWVERGCYWGTPPAKGSRVQECRSPSLRFCGAFPPERASQPLVARSPIPAGICQGGASQQTRRSGRRGRTAPLRGVGEDLLPRPVLAKPVFVEPQVTPLCRCPPDAGLN